MTDMTNAEAIDVLNQLVDAAKLTLSPNATLHKNVDDAVKIIVAALSAPKPPPIEGLREALDTPNAPKALIHEAARAYLELTEGV